MTARGASVPVPERRAEPVGHRLDAELPEQDAGAGLCERPARRGRAEGPAARPDAHFAQHGEGAVRQRYPVPSLRLHASGRNRPDRGVEVEVLPAGLARLGGTHGAQRLQFDGEAHAGCGGGGPDGREGRAHLGVRHGAHVGDRRGLRQRRGQDVPAGLSARWPCATAHFMTAPMRWRTLRAAPGRAVQIGARTASTSLGAISSTRMRPMRGWA